MSLLPRGSQSVQRRSSSTSTKSSIKYSTRSTAVGRTHGAPGFSCPRRLLQQQWSTAAVTEDAASPTTSPLAAEAQPANQADAEPPVGASVCGSAAEAAQSQQAVVWESFYVKQDKQPVPVQLPPPGASLEPPAQRPWFNKLRYRPPRFLQPWAPPDPATYNVLSFLGRHDPHDGRYFVPHHRLNEFLLSYFKTAHFKQRRMYLAENYQGQPFRYFQELDFPWSLDVDLVLALIPSVVRIVAEEASAFEASYAAGGTATSSSSSSSSSSASPTDGGGADNAGRPAVQPLLSMRTPYKVHLNFPDIWVVEEVSRTLRKRIINRCRVELSGLPPLQLLREEQQLQQQVEEAQQALRQLQSVVQQLEGTGGDVGTTAQQLLAELQPQQQQAEPLQQQAEPQQQQAEPLQQQQDQQSAAPGSPPQQQQQGPQDPQQQLDWESIIDFPHGSLRLLGSCKAPWMDSDPAWVTEKCYSPVECVDGTWVRQPLTFAAVARCSILLSESEMRVFEQSEQFLDAVYRAADSRERLLAAKRLIRAANKEAKRLQAALLQAAGPAAAPLAATPEAAAAAETAKQQALERRRQRQQARQQKLMQKQAQLAQQQAQEEQRKQQQEAALAKLKAAAAGMAAARPQPNRPASLPSLASRPPAPPGAMG